MRARAGWTATIAAASTLALAAGGDPVAPPAAADVEDGRQIYRIYCQGCHGDAGRGDGPAAGRLTTPPADLTRLAARAGGTFPADEVFRAIEGIDERPGHRSREMPVWGFAFRQMDSDSDPTADVGRRIRKIVDYLETIQAGAD